MATFKKEYPCIVERVVTESDVYTAEGRKFHTERAMWDTGADTTIDVISLGDMVLTNADNKTTFQFRIPSVGGVELT